MSLFAIRDYRHLFAAQVVALFGTGLATVALGLLAYDLAGTDAAAVLGTALTIKMLAYVLVAPIAAAHADRLPRRLALVSLDLARALVVLALPFIGQAWQIYVCVAVLQSASAAFTPTFQAVIPDIVTDEDEYTRALSASQLASTMESLLSPVIAAAALAVMSFHWLFLGTVFGFLASASLVVTTKIPDAARSSRTGAWDRVSAGLKIFLATPRLRGVLGLDLVVSACGSIVIVDTVNYVRDALGRSQTDVALLLAASGCGTMLVALALPKLLDKTPERPVMLAGAAVLLVSGAGAVAISAPHGHGRWYASLALWALIGAGMSLILTPVGRVLRRSSSPSDRPALFAAQFSLSHLCWLLTYPIAGWGATLYGFTATWTALALVGTVGAVLAVLAWPRDEQTALEHVHHAPNGDLEHVHQGSDLDSAHLDGAVPIGPGIYRHSHHYVIDSDHLRWPQPTK